MISNLGITYRKQMYYHCSNLGNMLLLFIIIISTLLILIQISVSRIGNKYITIVFNSNLFITIVINSNRLLLGYYKLSVTYIMALKFKSVISS